MNDQQSQVSPNRIKNASWLKFSNDKKKPQPWKKPSSICPFFLERGYCSFQQFWVTLQKVVSPVSALVEFLVTTTRPVGQLRPSQYGHDAATHFVEIGWGPARYPHTQPQIRKKYRNTHAPQAEGFEAAMG